MIHAPFSRSAQRERVFESARAFTVSQTSTHSRTGCEVLRTYRASATRLSRTKRTVTEEERDRRKEPQQSSNNAQIDSHGSQLCLRVPLAVRWRRKPIVKASPSVIWRRPECLILWVWSNKQKIRPAFGGQRKQSMSAVECSMADKGMDRCSNQSTKLACH
jgi:hypothetical protein